MAYNSPGLSVSMDSLVSGKPLDVVVAGLAVVDIIGKPVDLKRLPKSGGLQMIEGITVTSGGNVSNVGIDLAKLGFRPGVITRVGKDGLARVLLKEYEEHGLDVSGVIVDKDAQTSATIVSVDRSGERTFLHTRGCMTNFRASDVLNHLNFLGRARILAFGYLGLLPEMEADLAGMFETIRSRANIRILLDTGGIPRRLGRTALRRLLSAIDYFIPSLEEAVALTGKKTPQQILSVLRQAGDRTILGVKLGKKGCMIATPERTEHIDSEKVRKVVDTTGAGDAFVAGFLAGVLKGLNPFDAARVGNKVAASCVTAIGASTAIQPLDRHL